MLKREQLELLASTFANAIYQNFTLVSVVFELADMCYIIYQKLVR